MCESVSWQSDSDVGGVTVAFECDIYSERVVTLLVSSRVPMCNTESRIAHTLEGGEALAIAQELADLTLLSDSQLLELSDLDEALIFRIRGMSTDSERCSVEFTSRNGIGYGEVMWRQGFTMRGMTVMTRDIHALGQMILGVLDRYDIICDTNDPSGP